MNQRRGEVPGPMETSKPTKDDPHGRTTEAPRRSASIPGHCGPGSNAETDERLRPGTTSDDAPPTVRDRRGSRGRVVENERRRLGKARQTQHLPGCGAREVGFGSGSDVARSRVARTHRTQEGHGIDRTTTMNAQVQMRTRRATRVARCTDRLTDIDMSPHADPRLGEVTHLNPLAGIGFQLNVGSVSTGIIRSGNRDRPRGRRMQHGTDPDGEVNAIMAGVEPLRQWTIDRPLPGTPSGRLGRVCTRRTRMKNPAHCCKSSRSCDNYDQTSCGRGTSCPLLAHDCFLASSRWSVATSTERLHPCARRRIRCAVTTSVDRDVQSISVPNTTSNVRITRGYTCFRWPTRM